MDDLELKLIKIKHRVSEEVLHLSLNERSDILKRAFEKYVEFLKKENLPTPLLDFENANIKEIIKSCAWFLIYLGISINFIFRYYIQLKSDQEIFLFIIIFNSAIIVYCAKKIFFKDPYRQINFFMEIENKKIRRRCNSVN